jgi:hypothetical protein
MIPIDTARAIKKLYDKSGQEVRQFCEKIGISSATIYDFFDLLSKSEKFKNAVKNGLPYSFVRVIRNCPQQYRDKFEEKIIRKEIGSTYSGSIIAAALRKYPELATLILKINYSGMTSPEVDERVKEVIGPRLSDIVEHGTERAKRIGKLIVQLNSELSHTKATEMGSLFIEDTIKGLRVTQENIDKWLNNEDIKLLTK